LAVKALVDGDAEFHVESGEAAVRAAYERDETDEFIKPTLVGGDGRIRPGDGVIIFNFRPDRARQLTEALSKLPDVAITTLTEYREDWDHPVAFPPERPEVTLASTLASRGLSQLHVAETEKYAHVTYFFNGGEEEPYEGEDRCLVDSPRDVPTYDHKPEMSAREATDAFVERWTAGDYAFGIINLANPDMVGHTGVIEAAVKAVETVDECLGRLVKTVSESGGTCLITADHGNADNMLEPDGSPNTAHSMNPVPVIVTAGADELREGGILADVAPTLLALMGSDAPAEMSGENLIISD
jgi:2,3-bisphosphoglycerate-independent phosphoglycerate mutase